MPLGQSLQPRAGRGAVGKASAVLLTAPTVVTNHPNGMPHTRSSIAKMAKFAREGQWSYPIRNLATRIVHHVPSKQVAAELGALYTWVRDNIRYRFDPLGMEWIQRPERTVLEQAGDCDDQAVLLAALSGALGHAWRFRTVGPSSHVQKHVAVEAFDGAGWVTLDPVLEPPALSTLPRADLGRFGHRAIGADHIWDPGGNMLSGKTTPRDRELWEWVAYYPPIAPASQYGNVPQPGAWTTPDPRYRSGDAVGFHRGRPYGLHARAPVASKAVMVSGLGQLPFTTQPVTAYGNGVYRFYNPQLGAWGFLKKIGRVVGKGVHAVGKLARSSIVQGAANIIAPGSGAAIKKAGETEAKAERTYRTLRTAAKGGAGSLLKTVISKVPLPGGAGAGGQLLQMGIRAGATAAINKATQHKPNPKLKRKYPSNARQTWDARAGLYRVFAPRRSGVSGFGAIRPSLTFALGASSSAQATAAVNAVKAFMRSSGNKAPQVALPAVRTFQAADGLLISDGLWGPNARTAAAYYLGANVTSLPPVAAPYARTKVTWIPPGARAPAKEAGAPIPTKAITPAPAVAAAPPAPAGADYVQVGTEKNNPGLPPIGATPVASSSSALPSKAAVPVAVSPAAAPAGATHAIVTTPTGAQVVVPVASKPKAKKKKPAAAAAPTVVALAPPAGAAESGAAAVVLPIQPPPPAFPPPQGGPFGPGETPAQVQASSSGSNSQLMWAAIAYLWWQQQKRRRAA